MHSEDDPAVMALHPLFTRAQSLQASSGALPSGTRASTLPQGHHSLP